MVYRFTSIIHTEGKRTFIEIPFNVWEETALKGNIPCRISHAAHAAWRRTGEAVFFRFCFGNRKCGNSGNSR